MLRLFFSSYVIFCRFSSQPSHARWISLSFGATQTLSGMLMALAVLFTVTRERFASLRVCCKTSQRVKFRKSLLCTGVCRQLD